MWIRPWPASKPCEPLPVRIAFRFQSLRINGHGGGLSQPKTSAAVLDKAPERVRKRSPRYKVLLHNDPVNSMEYVVATLQQVVPQLSEQDCMAVMLEAHNTGVGLVIVCDIEPAEFYCETLKSKGLTSSIEPEN